MKMDARQTVNILNVGSYLVKFEFKLSNQMEKKKKTNMKWKWMDRQIKDDVNLKIMNEN